MKTIIVDDEPIMLRSFRRQSAGIGALEIVGDFTAPEEALEYAGKNRIDLAILDISMPGMSGLELGKRLKALRPDILLVFITAYDEYIRESNEIGADYYIVKPYRRETIEQMAQRMELLSRRQSKHVYIRTFGRFTVFKDGMPVPLRGKAKEILALVVTKRGKEIGNEECYSTIWEDRGSDNISMKVYYNAVKRLKDALAENGLAELLISTSRGQIANTELFDCDYYDRLDGKTSHGNDFEGEFMSEYSWGEYYIPGLMGSGGWTEE